MTKTTTRRGRWHLLAVAAWAVCALPVHAQATDPLRDAVQRAINSNPQVTARLNALRAAMDEVDVARAPYLPRVDLTADAARVRDRLTNRSPETQNMTSTGVALQASQLLWDGLATRNQVQRFDHNRMTRYFEFLDTSDQVALEAVRAYVDVVRERELVKLAEDNYVQHRQVVEQIQSRVGAGVGRGVDLEQANARLALAETNLATEQANLHDVNERYLRIVGSAPPALMPAPRGVDNGLPGSASALVDATARKNALIAAAIENLRAAQSLASERNSAFQPRVEARLRSGAGKNFDGIATQKNDTSAGIALTWNLFNGGADRARQRQAANLISQAADQRDQICREARQTATIAFNDTRKLVDLSGYLSRNVAATERARDAYRQQFDIGQRSLLDVLNAENELFGSRRALANANHDLIVARARAQAASTSLVGALGLARADDTPAQDDGWNAGSDGASRCPLTVNELPATPRTTLDDRARYPGLVTAAAVTPPPNAIPTVTPSVTMAPLAQPAPANTTDAAPGVPVSQRLLDWINAWSGKNVAQYLSFYDPAFKPEQTTRAKWQQQRTQALQRPEPIEIRIDNVQRRSLSPSQVETSFDQHYRAGTTTDSSHKTLLWKRVGDTWVIAKETGR